MIAKVDIDAAEYWFLNFLDYGSLTSHVRSGYFVDGAFWSSLFVPWRCFSAADQLIRVTVFSGNLR